MTYLKMTTASALCALCTTPALGQEVLDLDTITVSGSLIPTEIARTGASVEVIDGQDVAVSDSQLTDRLDRLPGVNSVSNGPLGANTSIQIRGLPARYVGVRINGIDVSDPSGPQIDFNFGGLTGAGLGRVEVLKGSQSALYGSEAIGGVVDISTWQPTRDGVSGNVRAEAGSFNTYTGALNLGYRGARGEIALSYSRIESDGFSARAGDDEDDGFEQDMITLTGAYELTDTLTVGGSVLYRDKTVDFDPSVADPEGQLPTEETGLRGFARFHTGAIQHEISYAYFDTDRRDTSQVAFTTRFKGERDTFGYLGTADIGTAGTLTFGLDYTDESFKAVPNDGSNDNLALTAEWLLPATDTLDISIALRHDEDGDFGGKTTGRIAGVWRPVEDWTLRAVAGTGFRAPSLFERFSSFGNPDLQPEESESYEFGVEWAFENGVLKATLFHISIDDLIDFANSSYNQVPGTTVSKGVEIAGEAEINPFLSIYGNYTYKDSEDPDGQQRARTPRHDAVMGLEADITARWSGRFDVRHVSDVQGVTGPFASANSKVGDYTLVGAGLSYAITDDATAYIRVENLFDEDYETAGGFNTSGRAAYAGLRASF